MKNVLVALGLVVSLGMSARATSPITEAVSARPPEPATKTIVARSSSTAIGMSISSATPTNVIVDTTQMFSQVCVQNLEVAAYLACSENSAVSISSNAAAVGTIIRATPAGFLPDAPTCFPVIAGYPFYCKTSLTTGSTKAAVRRDR